MSPGARRGPRSFPSLRRPRGPFGLDPVASCKLPHHDEPVPLLVVETAYGWRATCSCGVRWTRLHGETSWTAERA